MTTNPYTITVTENRYNTSLLANHIIAATMALLFPALILITNPLFLLLLFALEFALAFVALANTTRGYCYQTLSLISKNPNWVLDDVDRNELAEHGKVTIER